MAKRIAILGAGSVGAALGATAARAGYEVLFGVRPGSDASKALEGAGPRARALEPAAAARGAELVFLAVPAEAALEAARSAGELAGKVLVDCTNPLTWKDGPVWAPPPEGSMAAALAQALPGTKVVKAFNTFGAELHGRPDLLGEPADLLIAGDDEGAKARVAGCARELGFDPVDVGPLRNAAYTEALAMLWIHLALVGGRGRRFGFQLVGAPQT